MNEVALSNSRPDGNKRRISVGAPERPTVGWPLWCVGASLSSLLSQLVSLFTPGSRAEVYVEETAAMWQRETERNRFIWGSLQIPASATDSSLGVSEDINSPEWTRTEGELDKKPAPTFRSHVRKVSFLLSLIITLTFLYPHHDISPPSFSHWHGKLLTHSQFNWQLGCFYMIYFAFCLLSIRHLTIIDHTWHDRIFFHILKFHTVVLNFNINCIIIFYYSLFSFIDVGAGNTHFYQFLLHMCGISVVMCAPCVWWSMVLLLWLLMGGKQAPARRRA